MRIAILTFHNTNNYGAMLQAYALSQYFIKEGNAVYIVDYNPMFLIKKKYLKTSVITALKQFVKYIILHNVKKKKEYLFHRFSKEHFNLISIQDINSVDKIFIGSDQVLCTQLTNFDNIYAGAGFDNKKTAFYAASCGNISNINQETIDYYKNNLYRFKNISIREKKSCDYISKLLNKDCEHVLDPTLLISNDVFQSIHKLPDIKDYILVYDAVKPEIYDFAKSMALKEKRKLIAISCDIAIHNRKNLIQAASIEEFLGYFANAHMVISSSFHGCAIAISYKKKLVCVNTGQLSNRSLELLKLLGIEKNFYTIGSNEAINATINYNLVYNKLEKYQERSKKFIEKCLKE